MKRLLIAACLAAASPMLAACPSATVPEPQLQTKIVEVPVPVPCPTKVGPDPEYPDTESALAAVADVFEGVKLLKAGRALRIARESELKSAVNSCREVK